MSEKRDTPTSIKLTPRQLIVLKAIMDGTGDTLDPWLDLDQLIARLRDEYNYAISKESLQFIIRALVKRNMVEKRGFRERKSRTRRILAGTHAGRVAYDTQQASGRMEYVVELFKNAKVFFGHEQGQYRDIYEPDPAIRGLEDLTEIKDLDVDLEPLARVELATP